MNVFSTENRLNEKWVVLAGKLLPGLALVLLFLILPAVASAQFTCPPTDQLGFGVGQNNTTTDPIFCSYPAVSGEDPNDFFCKYNKTTGALVQDNDAGLCQPNAAGSAPPPSSPSLSVMKTHVGTFTQGTTGEWDITVSNGAGATATSGTTTVSDTLPSGYTVNSFTGTDVSWTCMGTGTQTATCTSTATISGGSNFTPVKITVNIPANSPASVMNTAKAFGGGDTTHTSIGTAASGSDTVSVVQMPAMPPTFTKTITTPFGVINQGDVGQVTFTITNPNASSLTGLAFTDVLPAGLQVQNSGLSNTCGGTAIADPGTNTISLTSGALAGSAVCTITANVIGNASGPQTNPNVTLASSAGPATATAVTVFVYPWWLVFFY